MKTIYKILLILCLTFISLINVLGQTDTLIVVNVVAVDTNNSGRYNAFEIEFNQPLDDATMNAGNRIDDWYISNNSDMSSSDRADDFNTTVEYIATANQANDVFIRIRFDNPNGGNIADNTYDTIFIRWDSTNDDVLAYYTPLEFLDDTTSTVANKFYALDKAGPGINSVSFLPANGNTLGINDTLAITLTIQGGETGLIADTLIINNTYVSADSLKDNGDGTYTFDYIISKGDNDIDDGTEAIPISFILEDPNGNFSNAYTTSIAGNCPGIDANRPGVSSISFSPGSGQTLGIDSVLTITIQAENLETGLDIDSAMVNGINVFGSFAETGSGYYTVQYTVLSGHGSIDDNTEAIPVTLILDDGINLTSPIFEDSTILASPGIDDTAPIISTVTLLPSSGTLGIGDTIIFTVDGGESGLIASTININSKNLINKYTDIGSGQYEIEYVIQSGDNDIADASAIPISVILKDAAGNVSNNFNSLLAGNCPGIDASRPEITGVIFNPTSGLRAIGDLITITINATENNLTADSISVNGKSFAIAGTGPYTISYTISEGDNDIADSFPIPIYFILKDAVNRSSPFTTSGIAAGNCPGIDANRPGIVFVSFSPGHGITLAIDSVLTVTLEAENSEALLSSSAMTVNGVDVSGSFAETGAGFYTVQYTVQSGHGSIDDNMEAIPVSFAFDDGINLTLPAYTNSTIISTPGIDDTAPIISTVTLLPSSGTLGIGDTIIFTVDGGESGLIASTININSKNLINKYTDIGSGQYEIEYVIQSGDNGIADASAIPISVVLKDAAGNVSNNFNSLLAGNCPGIDADRPSISSVVVDPVTMLYGQTITITIEVSDDAVDTWSLVSGTIAGFNLFNLSKQDLNTYKADFMVGALGYDILPGDTYNVTNLVLSDPAGNLSDAYSAVVDQPGDPIYTILPTAKVTGEYHVCDGDSAELSFQLTGSAPWEVKLFDGAGTTTVSSIDESPYYYKVESNNVLGYEPDTLIYKITQVTDVNGNVKIMSGTDSANVFIHKIPVVDITDPPGNQTYNINADADTLTGSPVDGVFSGNGIVSSNNTFLPSSAGLGTWDIVYTYTMPSSGCSDSDTVEFKVIESNADITFDNGDDDWRCDYETTLGVTAEVIDTPIIGVLTLFPDPGAITDHLNNTATIDIQLLSAGTYEVTFEYNDGGLISIIKSFTVESVSSAIDFTDLSDKCADYDTIFVDAINLIPSGGDGKFIFSGVGGAFEYEPTDPNYNSGYFLPEQINPGSYTLKYVYTTPNGCESDSVIKYFDVNALPNVSFTMNSVYNIDQGSSTIDGSPLGATGIFTPHSFMSNNGDGTADFDPADAGIGMWWVKYTYEDANACVNADSMEVEVNEALGEVTSSSGSFQYCYYGSSIDTLTGTPNPTDGSAGSFYIDDILITPESDNKILFDPQDYFSGDHTVKYEYNNGPTAYVVYKTINVDSIGNIYFTGLDIKYCENENTEVELTASYPGQDGVMKFTGNGITDDDVDNLGFFNPSDANLGDNTITYTFTRDYSGCQKTYNETVKINNIPFVDFYPNQLCISDPNELIEFTADTLMSDSVIHWAWTFLEVTYNNEVQQFKTGIGSKEIRLNLETIHGCDNWVEKNFYIGTRADIEFTFVNECHGDSVLFELLTSTDPFDTLSTNWNFGGHGISDLSDHDSPKHIYTNPGAYDVIYEEFTKSCGRIADTVRINIRPSVDLSVGEYLEEFEDNSDITGWVIENLEESANNSWQWGIPTGDKINTASSGTSAYVTNLSGNYDNDEKGMITSPCFDFSSMQRPMMKMDFISYTEDDRDGAVIQYTKPNGEWATIGVPNDGVNWYNSYIITGAPADQQLGWTGEIIGDDNAGWQTAMYRLDELRGRAGVRFRIVFGSNGDFTNEGFAFDNIQFSERKRIVLLENFTNINDDDANNTQNDIINPILVKDSLDVINLNYHTSFPTANTFNSYYPSGPSARALYYGVSAVPYSLVDGGERNYDYTLTNTLAESDIHKRMLIDPQFNISVRQDIQGNNFIVSSSVKALEEMTGQNVIVYVAIVEKTVLDGADRYNNVLRTMLPDAAGILVEKDWIAGDSINVYKTWSFSEDVNTDSLITIVFVQDEDTKEIYQTGFTEEFSTITSIDEIIDNILSIDYIVYPNPVKELLTIKLYKSLTYDINVNVCNGVGALVKSDKLAKGNYLLELDTNDLPSGVYYLRLTSTDKFFSTKKIIISN